MIDYFRIIDILVYFVNYKILFFFYVLSIVSLMFIDIELDIMIEIVKVFDDCYIFSVFVVDGVNNVIFDG